ncbi:MAG: hypothetical protein IKD85_05175 [Firmicutes bacterium]|nr:hypothetical protein [Bacillota bacterium]
MNMLYDKMNVAEGRILPDNAPESVQLRKAQNTLIVVGTGILLLGIWTVLKSLGILFLNRHDIVAEIRANVESTEIVVSDEEIMLVLLLFAVLYFIFGLSARWIIGFSAIAEGRGQRRGKIYIPLTVVFIVLNFLEMFNGVWQILATGPSEDMPSDSLLVTMIINLTSMIMMTQMLASVRLVRRYRAMEERTVE